VQQLIEASKRIPVDTVSTTVDNNIATSAASGSILPVIVNRSNNAGSTGAEISSDTLNREVPIQHNPTSMKSRAPSPRQVQKPKAVMKKNEGNKRTE
jgi:hypothetical protein